MHPLKLLIYFLAKFIFQSFIYKRKQQKHNFHNHVYSIYVNDKKKNMFLSLHYV